MKIRTRWLLLPLTLLLAACQPAGGPAVTPTQGIQAYPYPGQGQQIFAPTPGGIAYPGPGQGDEIGWPDAVNLILNGQVAQVTQTHSRQVTLVLKDGRIFTTVEPELDDVFKVIEQCGDLCSDISVATE